MISERASLFPLYPRPGQTDLTLDIRVGDLVIVEADRGKDLGTVVNDTITLKEVEAFEWEQRERVAYGDG